MHQSKYAFNGHFPENCQTDSVPPSLLSIIHMLTGYERSVNEHIPLKTSNPALSIAQLIQFNSAKKRDETKYHRYSAQKETPISIYIALLIHSETRSRVLIDKLHGLGLCISHERMLAISTSIGNTLCSQFETNNIVCPNILRMKLFTTHAVNIPTTNKSPRNFPRILQREIHRSEV